PSVTEPLRDLFQPEPGKAAPISPAIGHATGDILLFTDDGALVAPEWLGRADAALTETGAAYGGGRVRPRWEREPPRWLSARKTRISGVIALLDSGDTRRELGQGIGSPLGVNSAV